MATRGVWRKLSRQGPTVGSTGSLNRLSLRVMCGVGLRSQRWLLLKKQGLEIQRELKMVGPRPGQTDFDLSDPWEAEVEKQLRRVTAGLVDGPVEAERQLQAGGSGPRSFACGSGAPVSPSQRRLRALEASLLVMRVPTVAVAGLAGGEGP